mgnify:FL=1
MKTVSLLCLVALLCVGLNKTKAVSPIYNSFYFFGDIPAKTIFIKNPSYTDSKSFFAGIKTLQFEIFKAGSQEEVNKLLTKFNHNADVESCTAGKLYGDYQSIVLTLKTNKDRAWFVSAFKKAGLYLIKINNNAPVEVDEM